MSQGNLPFEPNKENLLNIENTLEIKSFIKNNAVIFIIEIPLVEKNDYSLYRLFPLPIMQGDTYKVIVPNSDYLLINDKTFGYANEPCRYVSTNEYLCSQSHIENFPDYIPCEVQLLRYERNTTNCNPVYINVKKLQIQNIDENKWILVTAQDIIGLETCKSSQNDILLNGTYLIELEFQCNLKLSNIILRGNKKTRHNFQNVPLLDVTNNYTYKAPRKEIELTNLNKIDLNKFTELQREINLQKRENSKLLNNNLYYNRTSIWTVLLYIIIIVIALALLAKYLGSIYFKPKTTKVPETDVF